ncbi:MAG: 50S ribosomal protein L10 [Gemmataceae bacterium]|nr:50S ribosomal protein L10 [Gemmataceae bacterium]MCS7269694.1 50S ribosomal protein L10 [Gemmataceae bacterium]MDW8242341.1 50S ribosomal protein L10 [Thermogemmata sp.]
MSKKVKQLELNELRRMFHGVRDLVLLEPLKLDAGSDYEMRKKLRERNIRVRMVKNTFARMVFRENGLNIDPGPGPTLVVWGGKSIKDLGWAVDDILRDLHKDPKAPKRLKEKTAVADGQPVTLEVAKTLPTREEAIGEVLAAILGPATALVQCLTSPGGAIAGILEAIEQKANKQEGSPS